MHLQSEWMVGEGSTAVIISASLQPFGLSRLAEAFELSGIGPRGALRL